MGSTKAFLILYFLFLLHHQHHFFQATSRSVTRLATVDPSHVNLPVQSLQSKHDGDGFSGKTAELDVVVKRGGGGHGGHGGHGHGGGGHSFGGGEHGGGSGERSMGGRGMHPGFGGY
ncbi:unnamed protein product [Eruca vesicaria subsp. sativa]|uniref:Glycine-rich protein n=1 Tax=Eruca vesicaria subsp. sativa TaxID=29727 RepID=A0ABC8IXF4_ERUVS|nr:unnamed protein product [Eruca vesicaria subsp. sativa]